ncbi:MbnP family protein [Nubsella zeaxanthinifaciens]|uniref:MbnP family protein n=1 Tax=Nubsella zeaxanthinifaciens TaxID=392412 RepID=UPI003CFC418D
MKKTIFLLITAAVIFSSCDKKDETITETLDIPGKVTVNFDAVFGTSDFALNTNFTSGTKTYNFDKFRYWVSNIVLIKANGEEVSVPKSCYLLEETSAVAVQEGAYTYPANKRESVELTNIAAGDYKGIKFGIGVEQKYNDNLSLTIGELSQLNGMTNVSWMWHTSYIFTAVGGKVTEGTTNKTIKVETGLNANYKTVSLSFPQNVKIGSSKATAINLKADVGMALDGIDVINTPTVGAAQATTMTAVANNYNTKVFSVVSVN